MWPERGSRVDKLDNADKGLQPLSVQSQGKRASFSLKIRFWHFTLSESSLPEEREGEENNTDLMKSQDVDAVSLLENDNTTNQAERRGFYFYNTAIFKTNQRRAYYWNLWALCSVSKHTTGTLLKLELADEATLLSTAFSLPLDSLNIELYQPPSPITSTRRRSILSIPSCALLLV